MKTNELVWMSKSKAVEAGFNYGGCTDDETMLSEIRRDYLANGYTDVVFALDTKSEAHRVHYFTKHPSINP